MSTSKLQRRTGELLSVYLGRYTIRENYRPQWLNGPELDFYIEELEIGIEVQGVQHYEYVEHFHKTKRRFEQARERDKMKRGLCQQRQIEFVEVVCENDVILLIDRLCSHEKVYADLIESKPIVTYTKHGRKKIERKIKVIGALSKGMKKKNLNAIALSGIITGINRAKQSLSQELAKMGYAEEVANHFIDSL